MIIIRLFYFTISLLQKGRRWAMDIRSVVHPSVGETLLAHQYLYRPESFLSSANRLKTMFISTAEAYIVRIRLREQR